MANGRTHAITSVVLSVPTAGACAYVTGDIVTGAVAGAGVLCGIFIGPDLDVDDLTHSEWLLLKPTIVPVLGDAVGWLLGWPFLWFWWPYARALPHRHPLSHWPILSTSVRLAYIGVWLVVVQWLGIVAIDWSALVDAAWWPAVGLAVSDTGHWIMDGAPI